jgi:hypothetical protein
MIQKIKKKTVTLLVFVLAFVPNGGVMLYAQDQVTTTTFSDKGTVIPYQLNPKTGEYIVAGTWNMDVNEGRVTNFTADMQFEVYNGSNPHSHQFMNFRQGSDEAFELDVNNSGEITGTMDIGMNNNIVHRNVSTDITIDRGVVISFTPDVLDHATSTIYGVIE